MAILHESMRNRKINSVNYGTLSDFSMFYESSEFKRKARGMIDIDFCYEKNGNFLFGEGKPIYGEQMHVPVGQFLQLDRLSKLGMVFYVGHEKIGMDKKHWKYYLCGSKTFRNKSVETNICLPSGNIQRVRSIPIYKMRGPVDYKSMVKMVGDLVDKTNKLSSNL